MAPRNCQLDLSGQRYDPAMVMDGWQALPTDLMANLYVKFVKKEEWLRKEAEERERIELSETE